MNLKEQVELLLSQQKHPEIIKKNLDDQKLTYDVLLSLGVRPDSEFYELYTKYFLGSLIGSYSELVDPCSPDSFDGAIMAHEYWDIPKNYILFTTGEGEGGYFYNTEDNSVWDCGLGEQHLLGTDQLKHWSSFYKFMVWYLTPDES